MTEVNVSLSTINCYITERHNVDAEKYLPGPGQLSGQVKRDKVLTLGQG